MDFCFNKEVTQFQYTNHRANIPIPKVRKGEQQGKTELEQDSHLVGRDTELQSSVSRI